MIRTLENARKVWCPKIEDNCKADGCGYWVSGGNANEGLCCKAALPIVMQQFVTLASNGFNIIEKKEGYTIDMKPAESNIYDIFNRD